MVGATTIDYPSDGAYAPKTVITAFFGASHRVRPFPTNLPISVEWLNVTWLAAGTRTDYRAHRAAA